MLDSDDVLLLRPGAASLTDLYRSSVSDSGVVVVTIHHLAQPMSVEAVDLVSRMDALLRRAGRVAAAILQTEPATNTFPALPVRAGEHVVVRVTRFDDRAEHVRLLAGLQTSSSWTDLDEALSGHQVGPPQHLSLDPTARSRLR